MEKENKDRKKPLEQTDGLLQAQLEAVEKAQSLQTQSLQAQQTQAVEALAREKAQAQKDYTQEQAAAYTDYKKQTQQHGVAAEQLAASGLQGSGFSESSRVAYYTAYQNRVSRAREGFQEAARAYDLAMEQARSQGNAALAQIALEALELQLQLQLEALQRQQDREKWEQEKLWKAQELAQEAAQAEEKRRQFDLEYALKLEKLQPQPSGGSTGSGSGSGKTSQKESQAKAMTEAEIRILQKYLGAPPTGRWDATTQKKARERGLGDAWSVRQAMELADGDHVLDTYPQLLNRADDEGFYVGQVRYLWEEAEGLLAQGKLLRTDYGNGTYRYHLPLKPKA